jgi:hypothetical protein
MTWFTEQRHAHTATKICFAATERAYVTQAKTNGKFHERHLRQLLAPNVGVGVQSIQRLDVTCRGYFHVWRTAVFDLLITGYVFTIFWHQARFW